MQDPHPQKPKWIDYTISLQSLLVWLTAIAAVAVTAWFSLGSRVQTLEEHDRQQELRFGRIEASIMEQRSDTRDQLRSIGQDVKELSGKFDQLKDQMITNSVANRPDIQRWAK
ncbi:hypothetical protein CAL26_05210 [Bordetella genomosp. 9]|uniref:Uncharacterized protein n=1 Tax=Bordetella genomosp. 9 TaxID=1416803 RepID=A0A261RPW8_9BORD|nr:hypothetical protein [Bordetella genomosp. 9]OZI26722.1 hypothetical protein CAL26_05210 [Bordetella genomosp. 9]